MFACVNFYAMLAHRFVQVILQAKSLIAALRQIPFDFALRQKTRVPLSRVC
jgi:hypothetical protein